MNRSSRSLSPVLAALCLASTAMAQESRSPFEAATIQFPDSVSIVRTGDFNDDGVVDGVGFYWQNSHMARVNLRTHVGVGDGTFDQVWIYQALNVENDTTWALEVGNVDNDPGDDMIAVFQTDFPGSTVYVFSAQPDGSMQFVESWDEAFSVESMVLADFDGDGLDDVAVAGDGVRMYRNTGSGFALTDTLPVGVHLQSGELDSVAGPDLAVLDETDVQLVSCAGATMTVSDTFAHDLAPLDDLHLVVGDIDMDVDADMVVFAMNGECTVIRHMAASVFAAEPKAIGGPATDFADIDGDGDLDGLCCGGGGPTDAHNFMASTYRVSFNDGSGNFASAYELIGLGAYRLAGAEDVDADGDLDLVAGRTVIFNRGIEAEHELQPEGGNFSPLVFVNDVDNDGDIDVRRGYDWASTHNTYANDGQGGLDGAPTNLPAPPGVFVSGPGAEGDFDGDGDIDVVAYIWQNTSVFLHMRLFLNTGGGEYIDGGTATPNNLPFQSTTYFGDKGPNLVADLDGDGDLDVYAGREIGINAGQFWWNDGTGFFSPGQQLLFMGSATHALDLDQDGLLDLLGETVAWGQGGGQFDSPIGLPGIFDLTEDRLDIGDIDGDGSLDLVYWPQTSDVYVLLQTAPRSFQTTTVEIEAPYSLSGLDDRRIFIDDYDDDGDNDVLAVPILNNHKIGRIFWNDGTGALTDSTDQMIGLPAAMADFDDDGDLDLVGDRVIRQAKENPATAGSKRQYGSPVAGAGGMSPTLGAAGPMTIGSQLELLVSGGLGGAPAMLGVGFAESAVPGWPLPGATAYSFPVLITVPFNLAGTPGEAGTGSAALPVNVPASFAGVTFYHQVFVLDLAGGISALLTQTNGLELVYP